MTDACACHRCILFCRFARFLYSSFKRFAPLYIWNERFPRGEQPFLPPLFPQQYPVGYRRPHSALSASPSTQCRTIWETIFDVLFSGAAIIRRRALCDSWNSSRKKYSLPKRRARKSGKIYLISRSAAAQTRTYMTEQPRRESRDVGLETGSLGYFDRAFVLACSRAVPYLTYVCNTGYTPIYLPTSTYLSVYLRTYGRVCKHAEVARRMAGW